MPLRVVVVGSLLALVACSPGAFVCIEDEQCALPGVAGSCEADGWCSFPDEACPSGDRYGEHAGDGKAGACVGAGESTGIAETTTTSVSTTSTMTSATTTSTTAAETSTTTSTSTTSTTTSANTTSDVSAETTAASSSESSSDSGAPCEGDECPPYGMCGDGVTCPDGACISIGGDPGTCFPSCTDMGCPDGGYCTMSFEACALPCEADTDCPDGMTCTELPALERGCMW